MAAEQVRGVVARGKGDEASVEPVPLPDRGTGEARVRAPACGVCHTGLHHREGAVNDELPFHSVVVV